MLYSTDRTLDYLKQNQPAPVEHLQKSVVIQHPACKKWFSQAANPVSDKTFSKGFWCEARKRHCDSRQHFRELLNKYVQPHTV